MWKAYKYETIGRNHALEGIPCQDKTAMLVDKDGSIAISLADGAGSARLSHIGATYVTKWTVKYLLEHFNDLYSGIKNNEKEMFLEKINIELSHLAEDNKCSKNDFASTLLFCAIKDEKFIAGHIGDGVIGIHGSSGAELFSAPLNGTYINETVFVNDATIDEFRIYNGEIGEIDGFMLLSDGSANSLFEYKSNSFSIAAEQIFTYSRIIREDIFNQLLSESFDDTVRKRTGDDCSIALLSSEIKDMNNVNPEMLKAIFDIDRNDKVSIKRLKKYICIVNMIHRGFSIVEISRALHIKEKYMKKYIRRFSTQGII